ncbi:hypothetical protein VCHA50P415_30120 [Vibrio chagasii]|nr:hypothetical protein VCHA34P126_100072 [Vibrio chagasii]CAH6796634.1 hypothetical protein VCHA28FP16_100126 [Vibrio chagasii]CAH6800177.1 hypothetical protein VCHA35P150_100124 [Vibrio chagasii]CAH6800201.1 hypothetical protein VCHA36P161_100125 [Vibrio chagasii]CAH6809155.1 hypothetical protein VCHA34O109_110122 [Vibrio chagasii]
MCAAAEIMNWKLAETRDVLYLYKSSDYNNSITLFIAELTFFEIETNVGLAIPCN